MITMDEHEYSDKELRQIQEDGSKVCPCYKTRDGTCNLGAPEMYEHDGGVYVEHIEKKQWVFFVCSRCKYQWAWWKIEQRLEREKVMTHGTTNTL